MVLRMSADNRPSSGIATTLLKLPIHVYRGTLAFFLGGRCRHEPSCSQYALDAISLNGAWRGFWLAVSRFMRCNPWWGTHGFDPAPDIRREQYPVWAAWRYGRWRGPLTHANGSGEREDGQV